MVSVYVIVLICFVATVVESTPVNATLNLLVNFEIVGNITKYRNAYSNIELTAFDVSPKVSGVVTHTLGRRTPWDRVIAQTSKINSFVSPQNAQVTLTYPANNAIGEKVTFVEINVRQTSALGNAYVTYGGIGKRQIRIVVEAFNTMQFDYTAVIYSSASHLKSVSLLVALVSIFLSSSSILKL